VSGPAWAKSYFQVFFLKNKGERSVGVAHLVEYQVLSSKPSTSKKKERETRQMTDLEIKLSFPGEKL
jgi:hypothetical protein